jgi:hypothetical protein
MFCEIILAAGLTLGCIQPPPARDLAAEVLIEQEKRRDAEFEEAKAMRKKLWSRTEECKDCPRLNTDPFPKPKE